METFHTISETPNQEVYTSWFLSRVRWDTIIAVSSLLILTGCESSPTPIKEVRMENISSLYAEVLQYSNGEQVTCWNLRWISENLEAEDSTMTIHYPAKSSTPNETANGYPLWGITWICPLPKAPTEATAFSVNYSIQVPEWFDPGKGMKLFWICSEQCPRGWEIGNSWVSLRLHSIKRKGTIRLSSYIYGPENEAIDEGEHNVSHVLFKENTTYDIRIFVNYTNGRVQVSVWDREIYNETRQDFESSYNTDSENWNWNMMFSNFYGWNPEWAPKIDTTLTFTTPTITFFK